MDIQNKVSKMHLDHLKTFHCVAKYGSFTQAAKLLFLTQPAVSLQIQGLENSLHITLFNRSRRKISLTCEGDILYSYTKRLFTLFDEIEHMFQDLNHLKTGSLTLAVTAVIGTYYLPPVLKQFNKLFPLVDIKIKIGNAQTVMSMVLNEEVDIGIAGRVPKVANVSQVLLHREPYTAVVGYDSPFRHRKQPLSTDEFLKNYIVMREKGTRTRAKIEDWFKQNTKNQQLPTPLITVANLEATKRLVAGGFGATALPYLAVSDEIARAVLFPVHVENFHLNADYYLTYQTNKKLSVAALHFIKQLKEIQEANQPHHEIDQLLIKNGLSG